ncbi:MAG: glycosyltransferase family 39 protein, partial [Rhodospirillales bacterium]|nr:glycosyltransferase family 39 protein [Rhodospirillales bacterium]
MNAIPPPSRTGREKAPRAVLAVPYAPGVGLPRPRLADLPTWLGLVDPQVAAVVAMISAFTVLRLVAAASVGLGVDEAYTLAISRRLALSYYDHPPLHQWIVHLFGGLLGYGRAARVPFVLLFAGSSWMLFRVTRHLFGARAGVWAVAALNLSAFFSVIAGGWVLPDGPLIFCLLAAADCLAKILFPEPSAFGAGGSTRAWALAGVWIGLAGLSKYQAILYAAGLVIFLAASRADRQHLKRAGPYVAALIAAVIVSPVIVWNAQ